MKKIISFAILTCFLITMLTSCGGVTSLRLIYDLNQEPKTLDPQYATDSASLTIINNIFEGLFTEDSEGNLVNGAISSYDVSADGLTYTFTLKDGLTWSNDYPLTAYDFEFAFKRLFDPVTESKTASTLFCIKNSEKVKASELSVDDLGVVANSSTELVIELEYLNSMFLELLTTAPAMPCNEEFFHETKGEYGLEQESILSNGAYQPSVWYHNDYIKLIKNSNYHDNENVKLTNMTIWLKNYTDEQLTRFENETTHAFTFEGNIDKQLKDSSEVSIQAKEDTTWGIAFNAQNEYFQNAKLRQAISACIDRNRYKEDLPSYLEIANYLIPEDIMAGDIKYRQFASSNFGEYSNPYDLHEALPLYNEALTELQVNKINDVTIIIPENLFVDSENYFTNISQVIQKELNLFIGIELLSQSAYNKRIASGDYDLAIAKIDCEYNNPFYMLNDFTSSSSSNISFYSSAEYDKFIAEALMQKSSSESVQYLKKAEEYILNEALFIPLYYQEDYLVCSKLFSGVKLNSKSGILNFKFAKTN